MKVPHIALAATLVIAMAQFNDAAAQAPAQAGYVEKLLDYARCIRANGYADFPDPSPDGRVQFKIDPKSAGSFEAAQRACKDKLPPGSASMDQPMTPERMQALLGFAQCVRGKGVKDFPDPSPKGVFEIGNSGPDLAAAPAREAVQSCMASNPPGALMIRRAAPQ
jgi:hypothetical protein